LSREVVSVLIAADSDFPSEFVYCLPNIEFVAIKLTASVYITCSFILVVLRVELTTIDQFPKCL